MTRIWIGLMGAATVLSGCAKSADSISAAYVSPLQFENFSCPQLREEATRVSSRAIQVTGEQNSKATSDAVVTAVGVVVFWPALFFVKGDGATAGEVARLKGEMEAIEQVSVRKNCGIRFQRGPTA